MLGQRKTNQFDTFIANSHQTFKIMSPRNTAPLANLTNAFFINGHQDKSKGQRHVSPNKLNTTRKPKVNPSPAKVRPDPMNGAYSSKLKPKQSEIFRLRDEFCFNQNHGSKRAQFIIHIDDEDMYYCAVCATQAASQGFTVKKIVSKKQKTIPYYPHYNQNSRYNQIQGLMNEIIKLEGDFKRMNPNQNFEQQSQLLNKFYDDIVGLIKVMKQRHLADCKSNYQDTQNHYDQMKSGMSNLDDVWDDLEQNVELIVEGVEETHYQMAVLKYKNQIQMFSQKIHHFKSGNPFELALEINQLQQKFIYVSNIISKLWVQYQNKDYNSDITNKYQPVLKNKNNNNGLQNKLTRDNFKRHNAFINLFEKEGEQRKIAGVSPQFKVF